MSILFRAALFLFAAGSLFILYTAAGTWLNWGTAPWIENSILGASPGSESFWIVLLLAVLWVILSILIFLGAFRYTKKYRMPDIRWKNDEGHIDVSNDTIKNIIYRNINNFEGLDSSEVQIQHIESDNVLNVRAHITINGKAPIQTLSENIQEAAKADLERITEMNVKTFDVIIKDNLEPSQSVPKGPKVSRVQ